MAKTIKNPVTSASFESNVATRLLLAKAYRANAKRGQKYQRVAFKNLTTRTVNEVEVTRVTKDCIWFNDGFRINRTTGKVGNKSDAIVTYIPVAA
jgi:hypothetical protein